MKNGLFILAVTAIFCGVQAFPERRFLDFISNAVNEVGKTVEDAVHKVEEAGKDVGDIGKGVAADIKNLGEDAASNVEDIGQKIGDSVSNAGEDAINGIREGVSDVMKTASNLGNDVKEATDRRFVADEISDAVNDIGDAAGDLDHKVEDAAHEAGNLGKDAISDVKDVGANVINSAKDAGKDAINGVQDGVSDLGDAANDLGNDAKNILDLRFVVDEISDAVNDIGDAAGDLGHKAEDAAHEAGNLGKDAISDVKDVANNVADVKNLGDNVADSVMNKRGTEMGFDGASDEAFGIIVKYEFVKTTTHYEGKLKHLFQLKMELEQLKSQIQVSLDNVTEVSSLLEHFVRGCLHHLGYYHDLKDMNIKNRLVNGMAEAAVKLYTYVTGYTNRGDLKKEAVTLIMPHFDVFRKIVQQHFSLLKTELVDLLLDIEQVVSPYKNQLSKVYTHFENFRSHIKP